MGHTLIFEPGPLSVFILGRREHAEREFESQQNAHVTRLVRRCHSRWPAVGIVFHLFKTRFVIFLILLNFFICEEDRKSTVEAIAMKFRHQ
jgi:hypothetical protein